MAVQCWAEDVMGERLVRLESVRVAVGVGFEVEAEAEAGRVVCMIPAAAAAAAAVAERMVSWSPSCCFWNCFDATRVRHQSCSAVVC